MSAAEMETVARRALIRANDDVNALTGEPYEPALDADPDGILAGVPLLIKDSEPFARGAAFTLGSRSVRGARASQDHPLMGRFRAAGLVTLGQTTTPEWSLSFATESRRYGITRNPWALARGVGGSSGGAAALVAAGAVPMAHASDGAGSIRVPASCCGLVGLKPGRGSVAGGPTANTVLGEPLGVDFAVTRSVRDTVTLFRVAGSTAAARTALPAGDGSLDALSAARPLRRRLRVAVTTAAWSGVPVDPQVVGVVEETARLLDWIGHTVDQTSPRIEGSAIVDGSMLGLISAGRAILAAPVRPPEELLEGVSRAILRETRALDASTTERYLAAQHHVTGVTDRFFERFDVLVTPSLAQLPAPHGTLDYDTPDITATQWLERMLAYGPFTAPFNVSGHPAISVPLGQSREGLPIGVHLVSGRGGEELLLSLAAELEQARPWRERQPSLFVG